MNTIKQFMIDYSRDVVSGEIVACQKHIWACERFLKDIKREGTREFPYVFDDEKARRFLFWMTQFKHTKGPLQGQNIVPEPIQIFIFGNVYGWIHKDTGFRRFRKVYWQVARKNTKTQSLACVGSYEGFADDEYMSEVYIGATKAEQAKICWNEIKAQIMQCDLLNKPEKKYRIAYGKIEHPRTQSKIEALSKDAGKTGDGFSPQCGIIDEYHAHKTSEVYDVLASGMAARNQPLMVIITTAGFELNNPAYRVEYDYVSRILDPNKVETNEQYFVMINELDKGDDIKDERNWIKANPIVAANEHGLEYLRGELEVALAVPEKMRNFLTKNMNIWVNMRENGYMDMQAWKDCGSDQFPDLNGRECYVGIDLSKRIDLTAVSFIFPLDNGSFAVESHGFMPEDTFYERMKTDNVPYDLWRKKNWLTVTDGAVVDYDYIRTYIKKMEKEKGWRIKEIGYDPYNATQFAQQMEADGYVMIEIRQGVATLSEPTKDFREKVKAKKIIHNKNDLLTWAMGNAITKVDAQENIMLDKSKSTQRIDPAAALINAHVRASQIDTAVDLNAYIQSGSFSL
ncbi:terminase large subunit [Bacillus paralicheniformis]|uniref:terminase large subunit n=1 Tax=Bacillus TaxID=1386 RepID=UPI001C22DFDD|nr:MULTISPECIES: terminase TerL endonuclease subunit [Bacillus]MBU8583569.1 terminase large subunit [Bacillus paralicheniformis]MCY7789857.1 terminase large subunit [Bacillus haynesii]MCY8074265.1 terminase large subunit [Bacillus haynesii]MCY9226462.1 terminase large subunit [Bacillus haynesii]MEC0720702.1 terminase large subunit [Bacillus haynesii]